MRDFSSASPSASLRRPPDEHHVNETTTTADDHHDIGLVERRLIDWFGEFDDVTVAFSGGVDSSVVLAAAARSQAASVTAVTATSPAVPQWQRDMAVRIADEIGAKHHWMETDEGQSDDYVRNDSSRCFHCKSTLYRHLDSLLTHASRGAGQAMPPRCVTVSGTNADDLGDHRPGIRAGQHAGVRTPLADLGITKSVVRHLARTWQLSNWNLPASPCLASRIAYGVPVTPERLRRVETAEAWLRKRFSDVRVRIHENDLARVEVPVAEMGLFFQDNLAAEMHETLCKTGFEFVTIDAGGLQTGSLNRTLDTTSLVQIRSPS